MRCILLVAGLLFAVPAVVRADAFDHYTNPVLNKVPTAPGVQELKQLTPELIIDHNRVLPNVSGALVVVRTNDGRYAKLLVESAFHKMADEAKTRVPILLIDRYVTYKDGQERAVQSSGQRIYLFDSFHFSLDMGQVVPAALKGDLRFVVVKKDDRTTTHLEPVGDAKLYLVTKPLPEAAPKKSEKLVVGETFAIRYFNGTYKLFDDGRRSGSLTLKVNEEGDVTGEYYSDKDGQRYPVFGKVGTVQHSVQFAIKFPRTEQTFQGWLFTGNGKALVGSSKLLDRESGFYALRVEDE